MPGSHAPRSVLRTLLALTCAGLGVAAVAIATQYPHLHEQTNAYTNAAQCPYLDEAMQRDCWVKIPVSVSSAGTQNGQSVKPLDFVKISAPQYPQLRSTFTLIIVQPPRAFYCLAAGQPVYLKIWDGQPTALYTFNGGAIRTNQNPLAFDILALECAGFLAAAAAIGLFTLRPRLGRHPTSTSWAAERDFADIWKLPSFRILIVVFVCLQLMDVATSIVGGNLGLFEGNPVAAAFVGQLGVSGFVIMKIPAAIVVILAMSQLPRRFAAAVAIAGCIATGLIVFNNISLFSQGSVGVVC